jgi:drug/metabolite transporter (DMT)-like permease
MSDKGRAYLAWAAVCVIWGTTYAAIRVCLETIPPFLMSGFRWTAAGGLILIALRMRGHRPPPPALWKQLAILGFLMVGLGNGGVVWAEQTVPSGLTALIVATAPFWMVGVEALAPGGEPLTTGRLIGLIIGFVGIVFLVGPDISFSGGTSLLGGVIAAQIACAGWALGSAYIRRRPKDEHVMPTGALQMLFGGLFMFAAGTVENEWQRLAFSPRTAQAWLYLVLVGSIGGFSSYLYALRHLPVATVSLYTYVNPVLAVVLGTWLFEEPLTWRLGLAGAVVLVGMTIVQRRTEQRAPRGRAAVRSL